MHLVKALSAVAFPVVHDGPNVEWAANELRIIDDNMLSKYEEHTDVFTVVAGPDMGAIVQALVNDQAGDAPGAKNGSTVTAAESAPVIHTTTLTLTATPITITDDAGVAQYGGAGKIYDFPAGLIQVLGAVVAGTLTLGTTGTITNTWAGGISLGTATGTTGATLTGTEADIMAENDVAAATAKVATIDGVSANAASPILDGTATAIDMYLNLVVDDDASHTSGTGTFTGTVTFSWIKLGDN
jgi:hypothetical protein